jgi:hypothetical protein
MPSAPIVGRSSRASLVKDLHGVPWALIPVLVIGVIASLPKMISAGGRLVNNFMKRRAASSNVTEDIELQPLAGQSEVLSGDNSAVSMNAIGLENNEDMETQDSNYSYSHDDITLIDAKSRGASSVKPMTFEEFQAVALNPERLKARLLELIPGLMELELELERKRRLRDLSPPMNAAELETYYRNWTPASRKRHPESDYTGPPNDHVERTLRLLNAFECSDSVVVRTWKEALEILLQRKEESPATLSCLICSLRNRTEKMTRILHTLGTANTLEVPRLVEEVEKSLSAMTESCRCAGGEDRAVVREDLDKAAQKLDKKLVAKL